MSENEASEISEKGAPMISEISDPRMVRHLDVGFSPTQISSAVDDSLPYHQLGGPGLELLCYSLISAGGAVPRYFGNPGQKQYGIDLIVIDGDGCTVYQCKNVISFNPQSLRKALKLFEENWLGREQLPKPTKFVLCCPLPLRELKINEEWTTLESEFFKRTGVRIEAWDKEYLDSQLKKRPDIVSDLFSDQAAERFCDLDDWNEDLFRPVRPSSGEPTVKRYLEKKAAGQIYIEPRLAEDFTKRLERHGSLLILGLPGSGKTTTGLALAESFRHGLYRVFYINMRRDLSEDTLVKGIRRRLTRPTIFLIDDCHGKYDTLEGAHDRLQEVLARQPGRALIVYVGRTTPTPVEPRADYTSFVEQFEKAETVLEFSPTPELFANITALIKPELRVLSEERLNRIFFITGRDLFLLDHLLDTIKSPDEIDQLKPEHLFQRALKRYFGQPTVHLPGFMMLTALAQFEIAPAVSDFPYDLQRENQTATAQLVVGAGHPMRYFFLHSSAAELVFRALALNYRIDNHAEAAALQLIEFFKSRSATDPQLLGDLSSLLRNRLKLRGSEEEEFLLKSRFLGDEYIQALVEDAFERLSLDTVALLLNILKSTDAATFERYRSLVNRKVDDGTALKSLIAKFSSQFLQLIKDEYPSLYSNLREQFADQGLRQLVRTRDIRSLFRLLNSFALQRDFILESALDSVSDDEFDGLIERNISLGTSISNISWNLRELKSTDLPLLERLERKIGAPRYLRLIVGAGTIYELFNMIVYSSSSMMTELIEELDDATLDILVEKMITSGRSIATINLALRKLKKTDINLLENLEQKIGARRFLNLIVGAGTIFELFSVIQASSPSMVADLIHSLDDKTVENLIDKTIAARRSIGTLNYTLRELKLSDLSMLDKLESKIGVSRWWKLILANGKINVLAPLMQHMDNSFREKMVSASRQLTSEDWNGLLLRGDLGDLAVFVKTGERYSPRLFTPALIKRLNPTFERLVHTADWPTLRLCAYRLSDSPDSQLSGHLQSILSERLTATEISSLRLDTFEEAARYIGTLWRIVPSKTDELVRSLFSILPKEDDWYKDAGFLRAACDPLLLLANSRSRQDDRRMLELCNNKQVAALCERAEPVDLLFYLWNLYSLWFKCERVVKKGVGTSFAAFLDPEIRVYANRVLDARLRSRTNESERRNLLSLCGFLYAGGLSDFSKEDKAAWLSRLPPFEELLSKAEGIKSFIIASFFLIGLGWVFDRQRDIPGPAFSVVLAKAKYYKSETDAFNNLRVLVSKRVR